MELRAKGVADLRWVGRLMSLVQREHVDVVHVHSPAVASIVRPLVRSMPHRPGLVYTEHKLLGADYRLAHGWQTGSPSRSTMRRWPCRRTRSRPSPAPPCGTCAPWHRHRARARQVGEPWGGAAERLGADTVLVGVVANLHVQKTIR